MVSVVVLSAVPSRDEEHGKYGGASVEYTRVVVVAVVSDGVQGDGDGRHSECGEADG